MACVTGSRVTYSQGVKPQHLHLALFAGCALVLGIALWRERVPSTQSNEQSTVHPEPATLKIVLSAIPRDVPVLFTLDLEAPHAGLLRSILFNPQHELPRLGRLQDVCGYDPSPEVDALAVAAFGAGTGAESDPALGVVAGGSFDMQKLAGCVAQLIRSRGGTPKSQRAGTITLIEDGRSGSAAIALLDNGLILVSPRKELHQMLDALDGDLPNVNENRTHQRLRASVGADSIAVASVRFPAGWLPRLLDDEAVNASPIAKVDAAAFALELTDNVNLALLFQSRTASDATNLKGFLKELGARLKPQLRQQGLGALEQVDLKQEAAELSLHWRFEASTLKRLLERLDEPLPALSPRASNSALPPAEIIPAKPNP